MEAEARNLAWRQKARTDLLVARWTSEVWREKLLHGGWLAHPRESGALCLPADRDSAAAQHLAKSLSDAGLKVCWWRSRAKWAAIYIDRAHARVTQNEDKVKG